MYLLSSCLGWEEERCDPVKDLLALQREVKIFDPTLCDRPALVCANKLDMKSSMKLFKELRRASELQVIGVSAKTGDNIGKLASHLRQMLLDEEKERKMLLEEEEKREKEVELGLLNDLEDGVGGRGEEYEDM